MYLGIDLGTSNSAVVGNDGHRLRVFKTSDGSDVLPSAVLIDQRGHRFVGRRAYDQAAIRPADVALGFKRIMGTNTPVRFAAAKVDLAPEEVSAEVIRTLLGQVQVETGDIGQLGTVITIPAAFNQMQTEATLKAAQLAGVGGDKVSLLHEPIAAAMASMAASKSKSGQFIVYDLGGGTFDVALVQSSGGAVSIMAHDGVNMLGGRDFDVAILRQVIFPWLEERFSLPKGFRTDLSFQRLIAITRHRAEQAKIELSARPSTSIFVSADEANLTDLAGKEVYVEVDLDRATLDRFVSEGIDQSIDVCKRLITDNGLRPHDIDRVVLIGGPSKMPLVRSRVPEALGIPADLDTDPMTAVAIGAAIYSESRDWSRASRKVSRASRLIDGPQNIRFDYPLRSSDNTARLRVSVEQPAQGARLRVTGANGWETGEMPVAKELRLELPLPDMGENAFKAFLSEVGKATIELPEIVITKTFASAAGVPVTKTLAVAVEEDVGGVRRERLHSLVVKGTLLPASGKQLYRAGRGLVGGANNFIDVIVYEEVPGIDDPSMSLRVGSFRLSALEHLEAGEALAEGDEIVINWSMNDSGLLQCKIEVPSLRRTFETDKFYSPSTGHQNFAGEEGGALVEALSADAQAAVSGAETTLGTTAVVEVAALKQRMERQSKEAAAASDPEDRRKAAEEARAIRQAVAKLTSAPENVARVLTQKMLEIEVVFDGVLRAGCDPAVAARFDQLASSARELLDAHSIDDASSCIDQLGDIVARELYRRPDFLAHQFEVVSGERYLASDKALHDRLVAEGRAAIERNDADGLRSVIGQMASNQFKVESAERQTAKLVGLLKGF